MLKSLEKYDPQVRTLLQLFILLVIGVIIGLILSYGSLAVLQRRLGSIEEFRAIWNAFRTNFIIGTIVISLNLTLLFGLFKTYLRDFKKTQSPFLFGLMIFLLVLFIQSLLSLPILDILISVMTIGPQRGFIGVLLSYQSSIFSLIANFFETIALIILVHLSNE